MARLTQTVLAINPLRGAIAFSLWTQQTVASKGTSAVRAYNASSAFLNIPPGIGMGSSVNGSKFYSGALVKAAIGPYRDSTCKTAGSICRWGDSSSTALDPRPAITGTGAVWFTNQYSGFANLLTTQANWRTWIWAAKP